ncbi:hypothetical protein GDO78_022597 [Eleutherodactylus coqui]|uniref:Tenascin n=1 Tax=Eleutherodactylus coqui TaxID=57060 RepID=A0A8J6EN08_ELECQ|nr:hypothetical protein GDO78_022597 [Eleutherodactylus coqui]
MGDKCQLKTCPEDCNDQGRCVNGQCICFEGFSGVSCGFKACPNNCHQHGRCEDGACICDSGFTGEDCSSRTCPKNCMNRGKCEGGICVCQSGFSGPDCGLRGCPRKCLNRGRCENGVCVCSPGFYGEDCSSRGCPNNCQGRGDCEYGVCVCDTGFTGPDCGIKTCLNDCNGNGRCEDGVCLCDSGSYGEDCAYKTCPEDCNEQGQCINGKCKCDSGFVGPDCGIRVCSEECEKRGRCEDGECICNPGFTGTDCEIRTCPNDCSNQGTCEDGQCICYSGYTGVDCKSRTCLNKCHNRGQCEDGVCICNAGFSGTDCGSKACPKNCNGNGQCINGKCICNPGFIGPVCGTRTCPAECTRHGRCVRGTCVCSPGYTGVDCSTRTCPKNCHSRGSCEGGVCFCESGFTGLDCGTKTCPNNCYDRGHCEEGTCVCDYGFTGTDCGTRTCPNDCHNRGRCDDGVCICEPGYTGQDCESRTCPNDCHKQGICQDGKCVCLVGYTGLDCGSRTCPKDCNNQGRCEDACPRNCNNNGQCVNGKCVCNPGYSGPVCGARSCPENCSGRGKCTNGICVCKKGFSGPDCSLEAIEVYEITGLRVTIEEESAVTLEWDQPPSVPDSYDITFKAKKENGVITDTIDGSLTTYRQTGLAPGEEYIINMQPRKGSTLGPETSIMAKTRIETPRGFRVADVTYSSLLLRWERPQFLPDRYIVTLIHPNGKEKKLRVPGKGDRIKVTGLDDNTEYRVLLRSEKGQEQSQDTEITGTTAGEERKRLIVEKTSVVHEPVDLSHTVDTVNLETSRQGNQYRPNLPRKEHPHAKEEEEESKEITTDGQKGSRVVHTQKNIKTIITTIYETHRSKGSPGDTYDEHEDSEYLSKMPINTQDKRVVTSVNSEEDSELVKALDRKGNLPGTKVQRWIITKNITRFEPSKTKIPIHLYEGESELSEDVHTTTNFQTKEHIIDSGLLPDTSSIAKKLLEFDSLQTKSVEKTTTDHSESASYGKNIPHKVPYSGREGILDISKSGFNPETSTESHLKSVETGFTGEEQDLDDLTDPTKSRKRVSTSVQVNKFVNVSRRKIAGREENTEMYNETVGVEGHGRELPPSMKPKNQTRIWGPQIKAVIENLPEKLSLYNGTFIQRLESYLRATNYPLRGNQTVQSVARAIFLYLVKWKPHTFTGMVYDRLPLKTPGATGNPQPVGASRLQGNTGKTKTDNRLQHGGKATDNSQEEDVLVNRPDATRTVSLVPKIEALGRVEAAGEINIPIILTMDKSGADSEEADKNLNSIGRAPALRDNIKSVVEEDSSKTSKPTVDKSTVPQKRLPPSKKVIPLKPKTEDKTGKQAFTEKSDTEVEPGPISAGSNVLEYDTLKKDTLESTKKEPNEKTFSNPRTGSGAVNIDGHVHGGDKEEHGTDDSLVGHKFSTGFVTDQTAKEHPRSESKQLWEETGGGHVASRTQPNRTGSGAVNTDGHVQGGEKEEHGTDNSPVGHKISTGFVTDQIAKEHPRSENKQLQEETGGGHVPSRTQPNNSRKKGPHKPTKTHEVEKERIVHKVVGDVNMPNSQMPTQETPVTSGTHGVEDKFLGINQLVGSAEDQDKTGPIQSPIVLKVPSPGAQGRPSIQERTPTSLVISLEGLGFIWDKTVIIYSPWPPVAGSTPQQIEVERGVRQVEIRDLVPGTSYRLDLHGMLRGRSSKSYSLVAETAPLTTTMQPHVEVTTRPPYTTEVTTSKAKPSGHVAPMGGLQVQDITSNSVTLIWKAKPHFFETFLIRYEDMTDSLGPKEVTVPGDQREVTLQDLSQSTRYAISLYGVRGGKLSRPLKEEVTTDSSPDKGTPPRLSPLSVSEVRSDSFRVTWEPLDGDFDAYVLQYGPVGGSYKEETLKGDETTFLITGLVAGVNYTVEIRGVLGDSYSEPESTFVFTEKPKPPRLESLSLSDVRSDSAHLTWEVSGGDFDSFILNYRDAEGQLREFNIENDLRSFDVKELKPGKKYKFFLYGLTGGKKSKPVTAETITEKTTPPRLESFSVTDIYSESVRLSWKVISGEFDSFLLMYRDAEGKPKEITLDNHQRSIEVENLKPGKRYKFILYGISGGKRSKASIVETTTVQRKVVPSASSLLDPRLVKLVATDVTQESITLSWTVEGNSPFDSIVVQCRDPDGRVREIEIAGDDFSTIVHGLNPASKYKCNVYGLQGEKRSMPLSTEVMTARILETQSPPIYSDLYLSPHGPHAMYVSWEAPEGAFDSFIVEYAIQGQEESSSTVSIAGTERTVLLSGLQPDTVYTVKLHRNLKGEEHSSLEATGKTGPLDLEPPRKLTFTNIKETSAVVNWELPNPETTTFKVSYQLADGGEPESTSVVGSSTPLKGLIPGTHYEVTVVSTRGFEESQPLTDFFTTAGGGPRSLRAHDVTEVSALLRWEAPTGPVDRYLVTYRAENIPLVTVPVPGDRTELPLSGLHPHMEYFASVQSSQGSMTSAPTSTSFITSVDTPRDLRASQITAQSALLTWKALDTIPDGYLLTYQAPQGEIKEIRVSPHLSSFTLNQLNPTTQYRVQLKALRGGTSSAPISTSFTTGRIRFPYPRDCWEHRMNGEVQNRTFPIYLGGDKEKMVMVFCDMETDGGGWVVFQRRLDGRTDFYRDWEDYRNGFGNLTSEFWLGNVALHQISSSGSYELRVDLRTAAEAAYALYDDFRVESEEQMFRLRLGQYKGNAGDSMGYHNNMVFATRDRDTQPRIVPCAMSYRGAWWYRNCHYANLNGLYNNNKDHQGINWKTWKGFEFSIPFTEMKMRPRGVGNRQRL